MQDDPVAEERERIARDLHDGPLQLMYAAGVDLETSLLLLDEPTPDIAEIQTWVQHAVRVLDEVVGELRSVSTRLHTPTMVPIAERLAGVVAAFRTPRGAKIDLSVTGDVDLSDWRASEVVHVAREAVSNAIRHGRAGRVGLNLARVDDDIVLVVTDDGDGIAAGPSDDGRARLGLASVHQRAAALGGEVWISDGETGGTIVALRFPA